MLRSRAALEQARSCGTTPGSAKPGAHIGRSAVSGCTARQRGGRPADFSPLRWHRYGQRYLSSYIAHTCRSGEPSGLTCEAGRGIGVVYHDGRVAPCELYPANWGNIMERPFSEIWNSNNNRSVSKRIRSSRCFCTHECFISASLNLQLAPMVKCLRWNLGYRQEKA